MKRIILMLILVVICGSLWAEMVFLSNNIVFDRKAGELVQKDATINIAGRVYDSIVIENKGKYKFRIMLCDGMRVSDWSRPEAIKEALKYGLPKMWQEKHIVVLNYPQQDTSLLEYTEDVKSRLKTLV